MINKHNADYLNLYIMPTQIQKVYDDLRIAQKFASSLPFPQLLELQRFVMNRIEERYLSETKVHNPYCINSKICG